MESMERLLTIENLSAGYGDLKVLFNVSLCIGKGEVVSLVGANGAGKSTLMHVIAGLVPATAGSITYMGENLLAEKEHKRAGLGIANIPQGRGTIRKLSVEENLFMGAYHKGARKDLQKNLRAAYDQFPILYERRQQLAGSLSGGEQQMLAISRALMMEPKLIIMDEPSLGLAPIIVTEVFHIIATVAKAGMSILLVEQNLKQALSVANRAYVLETGKIVMEGDAQKLLDDPEIRTAYLGV